MNNYKAWELDEENNLTMTALLLLFTSNEGLGSKRDLQTLRPGTGPEFREKDELQFIIFLRHLHTHKNEDTFSLQLL